MNADIIIIGAGIIGLMAAKQVLESHPECQVLHLDQSMVGSGVTSFSAAFAPLYGAQKPILDMAIESRAYYLKFKQQQPDLPMHELPSLWFTSEERLANLRNQLEKTTTTEATTQDWQHQSIIDCGFKSGPDDAMLVHNNGSYCIPGQFLPLLVKQLKQYPGYQLIQGVKVTDIKQQQGQYQLSSSTGQHYHGKRILLSKGPRFSCSPLIPQLHNPEVKIKKVAAFHINRKPCEQAKALFFPDLGAFLLPIKEYDSWLFSYTCDEWLDQPSYDELYLNQDNYQKAQPILNRIAPAFVKDCQGGSVFCDSYSKDRLPLIYPVDYGDNMVVITATNGAGFRLAPALAKKALECFQAKIV